MTRLQPRIKFDRNWLDRTEPGVPFTLVADSFDERGLPVQMESKPDRRPKGVSHRMRRLKDAGELLTAVEVASRLKINIDSVYKLVKSGALRKTPIGKVQFRISTRDLEDYLECLVR